MYFTKEDFEKIKEYLEANAKQDTDFPDAILPLLGDELLVAVQNNCNVKFPASRITEYIDKSVLKFVPQDITDDLNGNMNALLDPGIYKQCYIGRPNPNPYNTFYTLITLEGGQVSRNVEEGSGLAVSEILNAWFEDVGPAYYYDYMTWTGKYWFEGGQRPEYYTEDPTQDTSNLIVTTFSTPLPKGIYNVNVVVYPSYTPDRGMPEPTALPNIQVVSPEGGYLENSTTDIEAYKRGNVGRHSANSTGIFQITVGDSGTLDFKIKSLNRGYNWFVFWATVEPAEIKTEEFKVIPQICMAQTTGDLYKRVLFSNEMDLPASERKFTAPFTLYPMFGDSLWDKVGGTNISNLISDVVTTQSSATVEVGVNTGSGDTISTEIALPVSSPTQAGILTSTQYNSLNEVTVENIWSKLIIESQFTTLPIGSAAYGDFAPEVTVIYPGSPSVVVTNSSGYTMTTSQPYDVRGNATKYKLNASGTLTNNFSFNITVTIGGVATKQCTVPVNLVNKIYGGMVQNPASITTSQAFLKPSYKGEYEAFSTGDNLGFYLLIPQSMIGSISTGYKFSALANGLPVYLINTGLNQGSGPYNNYYQFGIGTWNSSTNTFTPTTYNQGTFLKVEVL